VLLSVRGYRFEFERELSAESASTGAGGGGRIVGWMKVKSKKEKIH